MGGDFYQRFAQQLRQGPAVLAIVVDGQGSVPREVGAKMFVAPGGDITGTIGGGAGEAKVIAIAQEVLHSGTKQAVTIDLSGTENRSVEGICGGWMRVWVERWQPEQIPLVETLAAEPTSDSSYLVIPFDQDSPYLTEHPPQTSSAYIETLSLPPLLLIVGAGHVGYALAQMAHWLGFIIAIQDERPEFANGGRFPQAQIISNAAVAELLPQLPDPIDLYVALVTRGFGYDLSALRAVFLAQRPVNYLGMIGSRKRVKTVTQALHSEGYSDHLLRSLHAPIGLPINALTPEEIAVSICAQIIQIRREPGKSIGCE